MSPCTFYVVPRPGLSLLPSVRNPTPAELTTSHQQAASCKQITGWSEMNTRVGPTPLPSQGAKGNGIWDSNGFSSAEKTPLSICSTPRTAPGTEATQMHPGRPQGTCHPTCGPGLPRFSGFIDGCYLKRSRELVRNAPHTHWPALQFRGPPGEGVMA